MSNKFENAKRFVEALTGKKSVTSLNSAYTDILSLNQSYENSESKFSEMDETTKSLRWFKLSKSVIDHEMILASIVKQVSDSPVTIWKDDRKSVWRAYELSDDEFEFVSVLDKAITAVMIRQTQLITQYVMNNLGFIQDNTSSFKDTLRTELELDKLIPESTEVVAPENNHPEDVRLMIDEIIKNPENAKAKYTKDELSQVYNWITDSPLKSSLNKSQMIEKILVAATT